MKTRYAILTASEYFSLNNEISVAKGYALGDPNDKRAERYGSMNPELCKLNIQFSDDEEPIESYDLACVLPITVEVQEMLPELDLVDTYISSGESLKDIQVEGQTTDELDYLLNHYNAVGDKSIDMIESDASRSIESDLAVDTLVGEGLTIISKDNG